MKHRHNVKTMTIFAKKRAAKQGTRLRDGRTTELAGGASWTRYVPNGTKRYNTLHETGVANKICFIHMAHIVYKLRTFKFLCVFHLSSSGVMARLWPAFWVETSRHIKESTYKWVGCDWLWIYCCYYCYYCCYCYYNYFYYYTTTTAATTTTTAATTIITSTTTLLQLLLLLLLL